MLIWAEFVHTTLALLVTDSIIFLRLNGKLLCKENTDPLSAQWCNFTSRKLSREREIFCERVLREREREGGRETVRVCESVRERASERDCVILFCLLKVIRNSWQLKSFLISGSTAECVDYEASLDGLMQSWRER